MCKVQVLFRQAYTDRPHWLCKIVHRAAVALAHKNYRAYLQYTVPLPWAEEDLPEEEALELFLAKYQAALSDGLTETVEQLLLTRHQKQLATVALETVLSEEELLVLRAKYDDGRPYEEIATITNKSVKALKSIASRALAKARAEYERETCTFALNLEPDDW
jgi:DNA-directed RNA polymerase specialized sigma24 family protein